MENPCFWHFLESMFAVKFTLAYYCIYSRNLRCLKFSSQVSIRIQVIRELQCSQIPSFFYLLLRRFKVWYCTLVEILSSKFILHYNVPLLNNMILIGHTKFEYVHWMDMYNDWCIYLKIKRKIVSRDRETERKKWIDVLWP